MENQNKIDYLPEYATLPNQKFCVMTFISPEGIKNCTMRAQCVRAVFDTIEEANTYAKRCQEEDGRFHWWVGELGKFTPWNPEPDSVKDQVYYEEGLQNLMKGYLESQEKGKVVEKERRRQMVEESIRESINPTTKPQNQGQNLSTRDRLKQKLEAKKKQQEFNNDLSNIESDVKSTRLVGELTEEQIIAEQRRIDQEEQNLEKAEDTLNELDQNLEKLKEMYNSMISHEKSA